MMFLKLAGSKVGQTIVIALAVGLILYTTIQYIQSEERDKVVKEVQIETLQNNAEARERVDENIRELRRENPTGSGSIALEQLRSRQSGR